jgi:hypothetical protein
VSVTPRLAYNAALASGSASPSFHLVFDAVDHLPDICSRERTGGVLARESLLSTGPFGEGIGDPFGHDPALFVPDLVARIPRVAKYRSLGALTAPRQSLKIHEGFPNWPMVVKTRMLPIVVTSYEI